MTTSNHSFPATLRTLLGAFFVLAGSFELVHYPNIVRDFTQWGIPFAWRSVAFAAVSEVICGAFLVLGALTRSAALILAGIMLVILMTAGRVEGGLYVLVPFVLLCSLIAVARSAGLMRHVSYSRPPGVQ